MKLFPLLFEELEDTDEPTAQFSESIAMLGREIEELLDLPAGTVELKSSAEEQLRDSPDKLLQRITIYGSFISPDQQRISMEFTFSDQDTQISAGSYGPTVTAPAVPFTPELPDPNTPQEDIKTPAEQFAIAILNDGLLIDHDEWIYENILQKQFWSKLMQVYYPIEAVEYNVLKKAIAVAGFHTVDDPTTKPNVTLMRNSHLIKSMAWIASLSYGITSSEVGFTHKYHHGKAFHVPLPFSLKPKFFEAGSDQPLLDTLSDEIATYLKPYTDKLD